SWPNLCQAVIERRRTADVGQRAAGDLVGVASVTRELLPPDGERDDAPRARAIRDAALQLERATIVEHANASPVADSTCDRILGMDLECGLSLDGSQAHNVDETRIQKVSGGRRAACQ